MSKTTTKAVAVQTDELHDKTVALQANAAERSKDLAELGIDAKDLVIPLIGVMQNTSELVSNDRAKLGQIVNMSTDEIIGGTDKPAKILPLKAYKTLRTYSVAGGFKFMSEEPLTAQNDKLPPEGMLGEVPVKRYHTLNYFILLKSDLEKGEGFPCLIRFRSTGMNAGRTLATHLYKKVFFRKKPYSEFVDLSTKKEKKDTNTYAVPVIDVKNAVQASEADMREAENWLAMLAAGSYKLDEREEANEDTRAESARPVVVDSEVVGEAVGDY